MLISTVLFSFSFQFAFLLLLFCLKVSLNFANENNYFQQMNLKAHGVGQVFQSLFGPEFEPFHHIDNFTEYKMCFEECQNSPTEIFSRKIYFQKCVEIKTTVSRVHQGSEQHSA